MIQFRKASDVVWLVCIFLGIGQPIWAVPTAMAQSVEGRREEIAAEFAILKKEIAKWKSKVQTAEGVVGAEL